MVSEPATSLTDRAILDLTARITTACVLAGLSVADAEDISQDVWYWLVTTGGVALAACLPWLDAVVRNFLKRYWRRLGRETNLYGALRRLPQQPEDLARAINFRRSVDEILAILEPADRALLLRVVQQDLTFVEAANACHVTRGSRTRVRERLRKVSSAWFSASRPERRPPP